jgi:hypothetical protein
MSISSASAKSWRGIEPLHSTRADVERLLGPPNFDKSPDRPGYEFPEERAFLVYSSTGCEPGLPSGWNVPKDTVMSIYVIPRSLPKLSEVLTPGKEYRKIQTIHTPGSHYYFDVEEGITFNVSHDIVHSITYGAAAKDKGLSCGEYKYAAPVADGAKLHTVEQYPIDTFGNIRFSDAQARLDNFVIQLFNLKEQEPQWRGYIIVYAGRRSYVGEAQYKANCYKDYLVRVRKMDPASLFAADGGFREEMHVELHFGRDDYYPPQLMPTVSPRKVKLIARRLRSCAELSPRF